MIMAFDPGSVSGAYGVLDAQGRFVTCGDLPVSPLGGAGKDQVNPALLAALVRQIKPDLAVVERVRVMPSQGNVSGFRFGTAYGIILGVIAACGVPFLLISPQVWKKAMGLSRDKAQSITLALQYYPEAAEHLGRKKDHGKAEALCLARFQYSKRQ